MSNAANNVLLTDTIENMGACPGARNVFIAVAPKAIANRLDSMTTREVTAGIRALVADGTLVADPDGCVRTARSIRSERATR